MPQVVRLLNKAAAALQLDQVRRLVAAHSVVMDGITILQICQLPAAVQPIRYNVMMPQHQ
jgi:hypothetical protein